MMQKIVDSISNSNKNSVLYSVFGAGILCSYLFYGRYMLAKHYEVPLKKKQNLLQTTFRELLKANKQKNIMKIVFTEAENSSGNFRKIVIDRIKQVFPQKDLGVLINCSPKKLYDAGCETFAATYEHEDEQYADYIINFLKTQLLIQDTIQKIQKVSQMQFQNGGRFSIMLCDNNCLDLKRVLTPKGLYLNQKLHQMALDKLNIKQVDLYDLYGCVIHFQEDASEQISAQIEQNQLIEQLWGSKNFRGFYKKFKYDNKKPKQENVNTVINFLQQKIREYQKQQSQQDKQTQIK